MFRAVTKIPATRVHGKSNYSKLYKAVRHYSKDEVCPPKPRRGGTGTIYTLGAVALLTGGTIAYAKYDDDFRKWLTDTAPFTGPLLTTLFQEEKSYYESISDLFTTSKVEEKKKQPVAYKKAKEVTDKPVEYTAPQPIFPKITENMKIESDYTEVRLESKEGGDKEPKVEVVGDVKNPNQRLPIEDVAELEKVLTASATETIEAFRRSVNAIRSLSSDIEIIVEESVDRVNPSIWQSIQDKSEAKKQAIDDANKASVEAKKNINELKKLLNKPNLDVTQNVIDRTKLNISKMEKDIEVAKEEYEKELKAAAVNEKYWKKVEKSRKHFNNELKSLFPTINIDDQEINVSGGDLDLFLLHAVSRVLYYQKELHKLETLGDQRLNDAIERSRRSGDVKILTTEQICKELEKEKRFLELDYKQKCLKLQKDNEKDLRDKLKTQSEAFTDHLEDAVRTREMELERLLNRKFDEELTEERCRYKLQISAMVGRLRGMEEAMAIRADADKNTRQAQTLWSACQALFKSVKTGCPGIPWMDQLKPLKAEINAVEQAAAENDELVKVVIDAIPAEAKDRGVFPEDALRERFLKVEKVARNLALVGEDGGRLHTYLLSYLQSFFLLNAANPIPQAELNDEQVDFSKLSTNEILQRARYWLDRGDFAQTLRYMNLLHGAPRSVARQWMNETRILLETQQAANTLMSYAAASGLMHL